MVGSSNEVIVHGMNFRVYDASKRYWNIKWLNALNSLLKLTVNPLCQNIEALPRRASHLTADTSHVPTLAALE